MLKHDKHVLHFFLVDPVSSIKAPPIVASTVKRPLEQELLLELGVVGNTRGRVLIMLRVS